MFLDKLQEVTALKPLQNVMIHKKTVLNKIGDKNKLKDVCKSLFYDTLTLQYETL